MIQCNKGTLMKISNRALVAAAMGFILLVTFGCSDVPRTPEFQAAYDECMKTDAPYSPTMKDALCKEYAYRIKLGWVK